MYIKEIIESGSLRAKLGEQPTKELSLLQQLSWETARFLRYSREETISWTIEKFDEEFSKLNNPEKLFTFSSRDSYLEWVKNWKLTYHALVKMQKEAKQCIKNPPVVIREVYDPYTNKWVEKETSDRSEYQSRASYQSDLLTTLILVRRAGRKRSIEMKKGAQETLLK